MPLNPDAIQQIRRNLELLAQGEKAPLITIGVLTAEQLQTLNEVHRDRDYPEVASGEVVFVGRHIYKSRIVQDGYSIEEVLVQISNAFKGTRCKSPTALESETTRDDGHGKTVRDKAIFECSTRRPRIELYSVIPQGDGRAKKSK